MQLGDYALRIYLLGTPTVQVEQGVVILARRQVRALLYRLAADPQPVARAVLCFALWPDQPEEVGRSKLSRLLTLLHQLLPAVDLVSASTDQVRLDSTRVWTDVRAYLSCWEKWREHRQPGDLEQMVALYGGAFLEGFFLPQAQEYETWARHTREYLQRILAEALQSLITNSIQQGAYGAAIGYAQRAVDLDELNETAQQRLLELYLKTGDRHAAMQQYEHFAQELRSELDLDPMPTTKRYYDQVHAPPDSAPPVGHVPSGTLGPRSAQPLRADILAQLLAAATGPPVYGSQIIVLLGEPGSGKTWCLQELCAQARQYTALAAVRCRSETCRWPLQPFRQLVTPANPVSTDMPMVEQYAGIARTLLAGAEQQQRLLLAIDDLHWADEDTLNLLAYLLHQAAPPSILLVGTCRSGEDGNVQLLTERIDSRTALQELALPDLYPEEVRQLAGAPPLLSGRDGAVLAAYCGGNPFYLLELLRALRADKVQGLLQADELRVHLPPTLWAAVRHRLRALSPPARRVIELAAVAGGAGLARGLGEPTPAAQHAATARHAAAAQMIDGLEETIRRRLLRETAGEVEFRHGLVRDILLADLSATRKRWLTRLAEAGTR